MTQTMYDVASDSVDAHIATCTNENCGCGPDQREAMIDALCELWLFGNGGEQG